MFPIRSHSSDFETMAARTPSRSLKREGGRPKTVTLQDVATAAGVTPMTVSRVIKGAQGVGPATRERVLRIAQELNYTANLSARALATGKTGVIAVVSGALNQFYYANVVHLLEEHITHSGYQMRLLHTSSDINDMISSTHSSAVDGVIIAGNYYLIDEFRERAPDAFQSCVIIDTCKHPESDYVHSNLVPAVEGALELMMAGRNRIAYMGHFESSRFVPPSIHDDSGVSINYEERLRTYISVMERADKVPELISRQETFSMTREGLKEYLHERGCPDAILCVNDETAMYVYRALRDCGFRIPEDVCLVGCDGLPFMECFEPPLSTIAQPIEEICSLAWRFLQERMSHPDRPLQQTTFDARLIVRASLGKQADLTLVPSSLL